VETRGAGGRDAEAGAAERRVAEALRAQASLNARGAAPAPPRGGPAQGPVPKVASPQGPVKNPAPKSAPANPGQANPGHGKPPQPVGRPGRSGQSGPQNRATHGSAPWTRPDSGQPTRVTVDTAVVGAPSTQQAPAAGKATTAAPAPPKAALRPPSPEPPRDGRPAAPFPTWMGGGAPPQLRWVLLAALLAGVFLGCLLAGLSLLDPGLLPALG